MQQALDNGGKDNVTVVVATYSVGTVRRGDQPTPT